MKIPARILLLYYLGAAVLVAPTSIYRVRRPPGPGLDVALLALKATAWIVPAVLLARSWRRAPLQTLGLTGRPRLLGLLFAIAIAVVYSAAVAGLMAVLHQMPKLRLPAPLAMTLILANALVEELAFRGFLVGQFTERWSFWRANLLGAALFVAVHWIPWITAGADDLLPMSVALGVLAVVLGLVTRLSGSIWIAVVLHAANNLLAASRG